MHIKAHTNRCKTGKLKSDRLVIFVVMVEYPAWKVVHVSSLGRYEWRHILVASVETAIKNRNAQKHCRRLRPIYLQGHSIMCLLTVLISFLEIDYRDGSRFFEHLTVLPTRVPAGTSGLVAVLRAAFATFVVPEEISSDGGPESVATMTGNFFKSWNIHHRLSSAYFPKSNGRAEVAVNKCKRLLMNNPSFWQLPMIHKSSTIAAYPLHQTTSLI